MYTLSKKELEILRERQGRYDPDTRWYAAMAHAGKERKLREWIAVEAECAPVQEILVPEIQEPLKRRAGRATKKNSRLLFPCYVFFQCKMSDDLYFSLVNCDLTIQILGNAFRIPIAIPDEEIDRLKGVLKSGGAPKLVEKTDIGDWVVIMEGPMKGTRGRVAESAKKFVKIEVDFSFLNSGSCILVQAPRDIIRRFSIEE
ncbi:MAG: hypothetical protein BWZ10_00255 [candidate division BRC1 bacterium ADurb.BinA364]|nr:MAG: hypothetical protein BWZ10_00255 [candidate division BRC1 bacterium ADurb.BinA364]